MPLTQQEKDDFDLACYGMDRSDLAHLVDNTIGGTQMLALSILSDAQHVLEHGDAEQARKYMNIAKWIIAERLTETPKRSSLDPLI